MGYARGCRGPLQVSHVRRPCEEALHRHPQVPACCPMSSHLIVYPPTPSHSRPIPLDCPLPSHSHPTPIPLPSHCHLLPLPLTVPPTPILHHSRWVMAAFVGCCAQCTRRVSAKPKSLAGSHPIVVRGFNTRGQVTQHVSLPQQELRCVACSPGAAGRRWPSRPVVDLVEPSFDEPIAVDLLQPHHASGSGRVIAMQRDPFSGAWMNVDLRNIW